MTSGGFIHVGNVQSLQFPVGINPAARQNATGSAMTFLEFADNAFFVLHTALMLFNMFGWIWPRTRVAHLVTLGLTTFSWFVLGPFYGDIGYCICTQWHFDVRRALGYDDPEHSYLQLLAKHWFHSEMSLDAAYWSAAITYVLVVLATAVVWTIDLTRRRRRRSTGSANPAPAVRSVESAVSAEPRA